MSGRAGAIPDADGAGLVRRYHFHAPGLMYVAVTIFLAVGAINSQNNLLFAALGLAMGGLLVSGVISGSALMGLRVERLPVAPGSVGRPMSFRYTIGNAQRLMPAFGLTVGEADGAAVRDIGPPRAFAVHVGPRSSATAEAVVWPSRRGVARLGDVSVWSTFPFGLARKSVTRTQPQTAIVRPAHVPLRRGLIAELTARAASGIGADRAAGPGDEFFGLREYVPGDSPRRIAWRASARTGELVVRQNAMPSPIRLWVVLRLARAEEVDEQTERAVALAASIVRAAADEGIAVGLWTATRAIGPRLGKRHVDRLLDELATTGASDAPNGDDGPAVPEPSVRSGACVVVHGGPIDSGFGPRHARHVSGDQLVRLAAPTEESRRILGVLGLTIPGAAPAPEATSP